MTIDEIQNALKFDMDMQLFDGMTGETKTKESLKYGNEMNYIHYCANEEAIELLEELKQLRNQQEKDVISYNEAYMRGYKVGKIEGMIKGLAKGWISCKKEMPDECEYVLVDYEYFRYGDYNCMYRTIGIGWQCENLWHIEGGGAKIRVFNWQPLPAPPSSKMEQVEDKE